MDVPGALEEGGAFAIGIVDGLDCVFDPFDRPLGQLEEKAIVPGIESVEGVERLVDAACPAAGLAIVNVAARSRGLVDRLAETRCEGLVVGAVRGRGDFQLAEKGPIALGKLDDHPDENSVRLLR
jgi:hypothetical protein